MIVLDDWQREILAYDGDILLIKGRRIGGTEIFGIKAAIEMVKKPGTKIIMVSLTEDQAQLIINVTMEYLTMFHADKIARGKNKPTLNTVDLTNGSALEVRPVGSAGDSVRGFNGHILGIDEAPRQPKKMWAAARPVLTTTNGKLWMWGTPAEKKGYVWDQFNRSFNLKDPKARFKVWYRTTPQVLLERPISATWTQEQRDGALRIIEEERKDMTEIEFGNEYLGLFLDEMKAFFEPDLLDKAMTLEKNPRMPGRHFLGVDVGRMYDPSTFHDVVRTDSGTCFHVDMQETKKTKTNETQDKIIALDQAVNYEQIGIDAGSGALGVGVYDNLMTVPRLKYKLEAMNNRSIAIDRDGKKKQRIMKVDYYMNLKAMMQSGEIILLNDKELRASLESVRFEIPKDDDSESGMQILGNNTHHVEGLMRAAWNAKKAKGINFEIHWM